MKSIFLLLIGLLSGSLLAVESSIDLTKPVPVMRLSDGRVLKNTTFVKFGPETVLVRSNLGPLGIRYEAFSDDVRAAAEQKRPGGPRWFAGDTSGNTETINGQIFVQTAGNSSYKFGNVEVYAFDLGALDNFNQPAKKIYLPKPIHVTTTDADGKFTLKVPLDRPYFIFAQASRLLVNGTESYNEGHEWHIPMSAIRRGKLLLLSNENRSPVTAVEIEKVN